MTLCLSTTGSSGRASKACAGRSNPLADKGWCERRAHLGDPICWDRRKGYPCKEGDDSALCPLPVAWHWVPRLSVVCFAPSPLDIVRFWGSEDFFSCGANLVWLPSAGLCFLYCYIIPGPIELQAGRVPYTELPYFREVTHWDFGNSSVSAFTESRGVDASRRNVGNGPLPC